jgi:hypothetical protein
MDRAINAAAPGQRLIGGIYDGVDLERRDVALDHENPCQHASSHHTAPFSEEEFTILWPGLALCQFVRYCLTALSTSPNR